MVLLTRRGQALPIYRSRHLLDQKTIGPSCSPTRLGSNRKRHLAILLDRFVVVKDLKPLVSCPPRVRQLLLGSRRTQNREGSRPRDPLFSKQGLFNGTVPGILEATSNAHDRPDPALGYVHNYRPVHGARGRAPSPRQVPIVQFRYVDAYGRLPDGWPILIAAKATLLIGQDTSSPGTP